MKVVERAYKYRLYPNKSQATLIRKTLGCVRFVYNYYLGKRIELYKTNGTTLTYTQCSKDMTQLKKELTWLKEVDKFALQNSLRNLDVAYKNFFREVKKGNKNQGFPKFKSKRSHWEKYRTNLTNNNIEIKGSRIKLPKLGWVKFANSRNPDGHIVNATISQTPTGKFFVSVCCLSEVEELTKSQNVVGIDLGIKHFATLSTGETIANPKHLHKLEKQLTRQQRKLSRKKIGSGKWHKQKHRVAKLHERIANQRKDFLNKLSFRLINENQVICRESLDVKDMLQDSNYAKSISDVSWSEFSRMIEYKADWYGRTAVKIDQYYPSSQNCHVCNEQNPEVKDLKVREWICSNCGTKHDRDYNASINIKNEGLRLLSQPI